MSKTRIIDFFSDITDFRSPFRNKRHELIDIIAIAICAVICGADSWEEVEEYAKVKVDWLTSFLALPNGIPSHDTINRVMSSICPNEFESCFREWVTSLILPTGEEIISIDGKTICGAKINGKSNIHMVSAWASLSNLVLGQVKVNEKSNEITAIPNLIEKLAIDGCVITIDAMGCQRSIADLIIARKGNYVLALKENQAQLLEEVKDEFLFSKPSINTESIDLDFGHGRIETRTCTVITDFQHITNSGNWKDLTSVIRIESIRDFKNMEEIEKSTRYYISSLNHSPEQFQRIIRSHWAIENKLHWSLDVAFSEDLDRKRVNHAAQNFSLINKIALNLTKNETTCKLGIKSKRKIAGWNEAYLLKILGF